MFFTFFIPPVIINSGGNMNKSVPAFVVGLIFSIIGAIVGYVFWAVFVLLSITQKGATQTLCNILPMINMATFALSFIGCIFCLIKPKVGGIIMLAASIISILCFVALFILLKSFNFLTFLFMIPSFIILIAGVIALNKRTKSQTINEEKN